MDKDFFISAVPLIPIDGTTNVPTALYYKSNSQPMIGNRIFNEVDERFKINQDFKIDIGYIDPKSSKGTRKFETATGDKKSAIGLTNDFFTKIHDTIADWFKTYAVQKPHNILISEPLSLQSGTAPKDWLTQYRKNMTAILSGQRYGFENIEFLPEPFAVFQYYRYGFKHPVLSQQAKQNALVIDFGGGTFDVCVIETTKEGDVRIRGKSSKPLAASSVPIGGFYINRKIAEVLILKYLSKSFPARKIRNSFKEYEQWRRGERELSDFEEIKNFIINFHNFIYEIETAKIALCKVISSWNPENIPDSAVPISIPENPYSLATKKIDGKITAMDFYSVFVREIWNSQLKPNITRALERAKDELRGENISVVLLSGGSANIGWLRHLILKDFYTQMQGVDIFPLPNYQEVVAQGLAIECARRFFTPDKKGDFSSITYNRICLLLNPNDEGFQVKPFKSKNPDLPDHQDMPGVLLPSASVLNEYINKPLRWRVKLSKSPTIKLGYKFLRSSLNPDDLENLMNIESSIAHTPPQIKFDSYIHVELLVKENATAYPKFIYKTGPDDQIIDSVDGQPFPIDLTSLQSNCATAYLGIDFGTSNSSISYVDENSIEVYSRRRTNREWEDLTSLVEKLPYPLSVCLAEYLRQTSDQHMIAAALNYLESVFALCAYISYIEYCVLKSSSKHSGIFKGYTQRSIGPLWGLFKDCYSKIQKDTQFLEKGKTFFGEDNKHVFEECVSKLSQFKHGKISAKEINHVHPIQLASNICNQIFSEYIFGIFEQVKKKKFASEYIGKFRKAHGRMPFIETYEYRGKIAFSEDQPVILNPTNGKCIFLQPLLFWDKCENHQSLNEGHCYIYDKYDKKNNLFTYKAAGFDCSINVSMINEYSELFSILEKMMTQDTAFEICDAGCFSKINLE